MDFSLTREQEILRDTVREFAQRELTPNHWLWMRRERFIPPILTDSETGSLLAVSTNCEYNTIKNK